MKEVIGWKERSLMGYKIVDPVSAVKRPESNSSANSNRSASGFNNYKESIHCIMRGRYRENKELGRILIQHVETSSTR